MRLNTSNNLGISLNEYRLQIVAFTIYCLKLYFANAYKTFLTRATMW